MYNKKWVFFPQNEDSIQYLSQELAISKISSQLLLNRGIKSPAEANLFFEFELESISSPFLLKDMAKALKLIYKKIDQKGKIFIYGDYDVDGITSVGVLYKTLSFFYKNINFYIPDRVREGYGLNFEALNRIKELGGNLFNY
ncbi:hypothetical protein HY745_05515 [Candidatus Desantisbacteria bacterium]|nr:hypothetical protein [Candidatus Desantisbacteria bacterium]